MLSKARRPNRSLTVDQLKEHIQTLLSTTSMSFKLGEQRVLAVLFLLLLAPAGARPSAILGLRNRDIELTLVRDPEGGPHRLNITVTMRFTKQYQGEKEVYVDVPRPGWVMLTRLPSKTFLVPEIIYDPSLFLSPHSYLIAILIHRRAFFVDGLNDRPEMLNEFDIAEGDEQLALEIKADLKDNHFFCKTENNLVGPQRSTKPISYGMMRNWVHNAGKFAGFATNTVCYSLRYGAANALDQCRTFLRSIPKNAC